MNCKNNLYQHILPQTLVADFNLKIEY